ncbi:MAG TPA: hypothetical protein VKD90_22625, partial [Gemmataceae bacterium]|nr:hypothetical protein [Gemmataceae bacterium]
DGLVVRVDQAGVRGVLAGSELDEDALHPVRELPADRGRDAVALVLALLAVQQAPRQPPKANTLSS